MANLGEFEEEEIREPVDWPTEVPVPIEPAAPAAPVTTPEKVPA